MCLLLFFSLVWSHVDSSSDFQNLFNGFARLNADRTLTGVPYQDSGNYLERGYVYYGIQYGRAQRFENSVMNTDFSYFDDTDHPKAGYVCPQAQSIIPAWAERKLIFSEECLYLDVYVPPLTLNQKETFPVMFWIYGGDFMTGDKDFYNATLLSASIKVIVVTVNYRLGAFGFLSTGNNLAKGNWALGDIKLALKWTTSNIASFGGDPEKITIFGESAGGALTSAMMMDDDVRGTVQAAIALSGSMEALWTDYTQMALTGVQFEASFHDCPIEPLEATMSCLKSVPFESFIAPRNAPAFGINLIWGPVIDGVHIKALHPNTIPQSTKSPKRDATFITGYLNQDSSFLIYGLLPQIFGVAHFNYSVFQQVLPIVFPLTVFCPNEQRAILNEIEAFYNVSQADDDTTILKGLVRITTDLMFGYPAIKESMAYASRSFSNQVPNYLYTISYDPDYLGWGPFHMLDVVLIFRGQTEVLMPKIQPTTDVATASIRNFLQQVAYTGQLQLENSSFAGDRSFLNLNSAGKWEEDSEDFDPLIKLWDKVGTFECP